VANKWFGATPTKLEVDRMLSVSTGHITRCDGELLNNSTFAMYGCISGAAYEYGAFVYCGYLDEEERRLDRKALMEIGFSPQFVDILDYAHSIGCRYVCFDADAREYGEIPTCNW
jgi:hypothetical protein